MYNFFFTLLSNFFNFSKRKAYGSVFLVVILLVGVFFPRHIMRYYYETDVEEGKKQEFENWVGQISESIVFNSEKKDEKEEDKTIYYFPKKSKKDKKYNAPNFKFKVKSKPFSKKIASNVINDDINSTDETELKKIYGIGDKLSSRIIKYRNLLGGFHSMNQLKEVYGMENEVIKKTKKYFKIRSGVKYLDINNDTAKILARHPYISFDDAWVVINYRKQHGNIEKAEQLKNLKIFDTIQLKKIIPYLEH